MARAIATWFGVGYAPVAPGTFGAVAALPLHWALRAWGPLPYAAVTVGLTIAGTWAADRVVKASEDEDPPYVVIDEVVGTLIGLGLTRKSGWRAQLLSVVAFRVLDIVKPGFIDSAQRLRPPGVGIMADDVLAGIGAGLLGRLLRRG